MLKQYGFEIGLQLMVGMPGQSFDSVKATVEQVLRLDPSFARIYPLLVIKGTPLEHIYERGEFELLTLEAAVEQSAYVYSKLTLAGIKVIRVGLQADEELCSEGNIVAGPFHPSFGELVQSFLLYAELTPQLQRLFCQGAGNIVITCPSKLESKLRGLKNNNLRRWQQLAGPVPVNIKARPDAERIMISWRLDDE